MTSKINRCHYRDGKQVCIKIAVDGKFCIDHSTIPVGGRGSTTTPLVGSNSISVKDQNKKELKEETAVECRIC